MTELEKRLATLRADFDQAWQKLGLDQRLEELEQLEREVAVPELWHQPDLARAKNTALAKLHVELDAWLLLRTQIKDLGELLALSSADLETEIASQLDAMVKNFTELRQALRFTGKFDHNDVVLRITAGAGGTEAMDWASMLERMYLRWAEQHHVKTQLLDRVAGEEAGIKTSVLELTGASNLYGRLKSEHGTHRLVRLSPFNADHLRQTSFALVEVLPIIKDDQEVALDPKDLRIDVFHSGGHGGQSVNTTNSAVRITHLPTNTVVSIQNERSQLQNKEKAMEILRGKLQQMMQEQNAASLGELRAGESASWGQQIRNYVLHPYQLVKDTRTKYEESDAAAVLDGKIDAFLTAFLDQ